MNNSHFNTIIHYVINALTPLALVVAAPFVLIKASIDPRWRKGLDQRLGILPPLVNLEKRDDYRIWVHTASVGEVNTALHFGEMIRKRWPDAGIVLSTLTATGQETARSRAGWADECIYLPLDWGPVVRRVVDKISPDLFIMCETEIWPSLLRCLKSKGVATALVNGRISDKTTNRYRAARPFFRAILEYIDCFAMQSGEDERRIISIGAPAERVNVLGNFKFDTSLPKDPNAAPGLSREQLGLDPDALLLVAGSTHEPEEAMIADLFLNLKEKFERINLVIAPRHPQRFDQVAALLSEKKIDFARRSRSREPKPEKGDILLLDTLGELAHVYRLADLVIMGGSFAPVGGHNILEAAAWRKPVIVGPHNENFRDVTRQMMEKEAVVQVRDPNKLPEVAEFLLRDRNYRDNMGNRAREVIDSNLGAASRTLEYLLDRLKLDENQK
jgi:3-deoxy-D-manno-octulosonic-acid transferase